MNKHVAIPEKMSDPRAPALKNKIIHWSKGKYYSLKWQDHPKADLAVEGLSSIFRYQHDFDEFKSIEALILGAGACYDVEFQPSRLTLIYFIPPVPTSNIWCVRLAAGKYRDFFEKGVLEISIKAGVLGREGKPVEVHMRPVEKGEQSEYWAFWDTIDRKYDFCYPGEFLVRCTDDGFKRDERENKGRVTNVMIEEV